MGGEAIVGCISIDLKFRTAVTQALHLQQQSPLPLAGFRVFAKHPQPHLDDIQHRDRGNGGTDR
ncbi:hypothetical protein CKA32_003849 [Geitlerinema sp. FC II]|nr:hypothetical protein CKA32_003849 [Geitlerinema sp. FC II]